MSVFCITSSPDVPETNWGKLWTESTSSRQREHLTASEHIYIVLHEHWTGPFRPPLTQQKHKEVAAGEGAPQRTCSTQITSASSYRQCFVIQHEECHSWCITPGTWAALLQYAHVDDAHGTSTDVDRCHFCTDSHLREGEHLPEELSWTTGLINKVIMLEAFRCLRNNKYYIYSLKASFIH